MAAGEDNRAGTVQETHRGPSAGATVPRGTRRVGTAAGRWTPFLAVALVVAGTLGLAVGGSSPAAAADLRPQATVQGDDVTVSWQPVDGATKYMVKFAPAGSRKFTWRRSFRTQTTRRLNDLGPGDYDIWVRAFRGRTALPWEGPVRITVPGRDGLGASTTTTTSAPATTAPATTAPPATDIAPAGGDDRPPPPAGADPVVEVNGTDFVVDGTPTFVLGISYFDCHHHDAADLRYLAERGFDLVRCWLDRGRGYDNLTRQRPNPVPPGELHDYTVFDGRGSLVEDRARRVDTFLDDAAAAGLLVEFVVSHKGLASSQLDAPQHGSIRLEVPPATFATNAVTSAMARWGRRTHVIWDVHNEEGLYVREDRDGDGRTESYGRGIVDLTQMDRLVGAARQSGPRADGRPPVVFFSDRRLDQTTAAATLRRIGRMRNGPDLIAPHFIRNAAWATTTAKRIERLKDPGQRDAWRGPIYLSEENAAFPQFQNDRRPPLPLSDFHTAVRQARTAGAAGWVFHTRAAFDLKGTNIRAELRGVEIEAVCTLAAQIGRRTTPC